LIIAGRIEAAEGDRAPLKEKKKRKKKIVLCYVA